MELETAPESLPLAVVVGLLEELEEPLPGWSKIEGLDCDALTWAPPDVLRALGEGSVLDMGQLVRDPPAGTGASGTFPKGFAAWALPKRLPEGVDCVPDVDAPNGVNVGVPPTIEPEGEYVKPVLGTCGPI